jgi:hypothetical protein
MSLGKWLLYTVVLALSPIWVRLLIVGVFIPDCGIRWLAESDIATFGLILVITNISGLESSSVVEPDWKSKHIALSMALALVFATLFVGTCVQELPIQPNPVSRNRLLVAVLSLSSVSVVYSYSIWNRLAEAQSASRGQ